MANANVLGASHNRVGRLERPKLVTIARALHDYGIGRTKLYELMKDGAIRAVKLGGRTLIDVASADAFFEALPEIRSPRK
jgi:excisionase family DNA binding protein